MARPGQSKRIRVMAIGEPSALGFEPMEALGDVEILPALEIVAAHLIEDDENGELGLWCEWRWFDRQKRDAGQDWQQQNCESCAHHGNAPGCSVPLSRRCGRGLAV